MRLRSALALGVVAWHAVAACGWDPSRPFEREAPPVNEAIRALDAGDATAAASTLEAYLSTGRCESGNIGTPEIVKRRPNGSFDLGLSLFKIGEAYGRRFGDEEVDGGPGPEANPEVAERNERLTEDVDDLLDEIDSVLEENAEEFVRGYVQKGGQ